MKSFDVRCYFVHQVSSLDIIHSLRVLSFFASDVFEASSHARDFLQSHAEELELLGSLDKIEVVEVNSELH